jgi:hypothetical protein
MHYRE